MNVSIKSIKLDLRASTANPDSEETLVRVSESAIPSFNRLQWVRYLTGVKVRKGFSGERFQAKVRRESFDKPDVNVSVE